MHYYPLPAHVKRLILSIKHDVGQMINRPRRHTSLASFQEKMELKDSTVEAGCCILALVIRTKDPPIPGAGVFFLTPRWTLAWRLLSVIDCYGFEVAFPGRRGDGESD